ncbi:hypothetical protein MICAD_280022 [Microcystis aeruginosa PCC 7941]|jgi:hypothetical protein|nr:hypothetical protein MICAD_280022 [Microcystis aeruginosa PCC 7941]
MYIILAATPSEPESFELPFATQLAYLPAYFPEFSPILFFS